MYGFEVMSMLTNALLQELIGRIFDTAPLAHTMAMWAPVSNAVNFMVILRKSTIAVKEARSSEEHHSTCPSCQSSQSSSPPATSIVSKLLAGTSGKMNDYTSKGIALDEDTGVNCYGE